MFEVEFKMMSEAERERKSKAHTPAGVVQIPDHRKHRVAKLFGKYGCLTQRVPLCPWIYGLGPNPLVLRHAQGF